MLVRAKLIRNAWYLPYAPPPLNLLGIPARLAAAAWRAAAAAQRPHHAASADDAKAWPLAGGGGGAEGESARSRSRSLRRRGTARALGPTTYWQMHEDEHDRARDDDVEQAASAAVQALGAARMSDVRAAGAAGAPAAAAGGGPAAERQASLEQRRAWRASADARTAHYHRTMSAWRQRQSALERGASESGGADGAWAARGGSGLVGTPDPTDADVLELLGYLAEHAPDVDEGERWRRAFSRRLTGMERRVMQALNAHARELAAIARLAADTSARVKALGATTIGPPGPDATSSAQ